jgi:formylglycine-generating enzyme
MFRRGAIALTSPGRAYLRNFYDSRMRWGVVILGAHAVLAINAAAVVARVISPADFSSTAVVETFEDIKPFGTYWPFPTPFTLPSGAQLCEPYPNQPGSYRVHLVDGVGFFGYTFSSIAPYVPSGTAYVGQANAGAYDNGIVFAFPAGVFRAGAYVAADPWHIDGGPVLVSSYDASGNLLASVTIDHATVSGWKNRFVGFEEPAGIGSIRFLGDSGSTVRLDDLTFEAVPEPSTLIFIGIGAVGLLAYAWRRRASRQAVTALAAIAVVLSVAVAQADVFNMGGTRDPTTGTWTGSASLEFVAVGDPGNAADRLYTGISVGAVNYTYSIGEYDVTVGQYCQFLNTVAKLTDTYGLYNSYMATSFATIGIARSGSPGGYTYSVTGSYAQAANCPIFLVSWGDAARFCNWLQNGQPTGPEGNGTTETGAYTLNGATSSTALMAITRNAGVRYFLPTENEWHKAAYYQGGGTNSGYWTYPTQSNAAPSNVLSATGTNNANYNNGGYTDPINYLTPVGALAHSPSSYGTYDQGGDMNQWNETAVSSSSRGFEGGSWFSTGSIYLASRGGNGNSPVNESVDGGFRVASIGVPSLKEPFVSRASWRFFARTVRAEAW